MRISDWSSDVCSSDLFDCKSSAASISSSIWLIALSPAFAIWVWRSRNRSVAAVRDRNVNDCVMARLKSTESSDSNWRGVVDDGYSRMPKMPPRSEEHTSELQSLMRISYAVFCLKKKNNTPNSHR